MIDSSGWLAEAKGFLRWGVTARRDDGMQLTPLRVPKIVGFLTVSIGSYVILIYRWRRN
jgi:hypothetical protein